MIEIPDESIETWLECLKKYQQEAVMSLVVEYGEDTAAEKWLSAKGFSNTIPFGGQRDTKPFFDNFKIEFKKFICGHPDYEKERKKISDQKEIVSALFISTISAAIGSVLGMAGALLAPAVAIMLYIVGKMGTKAYCKTDS